MQNHKNNLAVTLLTFIMMSSSAKAESSKSKLERDIKFNAGHYDVTAKEDKNTYCLPGLMEISGEGKNQILYLGAHLLFGDINAGAVEDIDVDGCKITSTSKSHRGIIHLPRVNIVSDVVCTWGSYHDVTEIKFGSDTFEYSFTRESTDQKKLPSFKSTCSFKKAP